MSAPGSAGGASDPAAAAAEYAALLSTMSSLQNVYFASIGAIAWLVYDIALTLEPEVEFIWKARWSFPKILYILARYYGLFNLTYYLSIALSTSVSVPYCERWIWFDGFSNSVFFTTTVNLLFVFRISALFEGKRSMLAFLLFLYAAEFIIEVIVTVLTLRGVAIVPRPPGLPTRGCSSASAPTLTLVSWITCLIVACIFWMLTTYRLARNMGVRTWFNLKLVATRVRGYPIMDVFYRDGSLFFGMIFVVILLNTVFNQLGGVYLAIGQPWLSAAYSVAGSRLVLNLKSISRRPASARLQMSSFSANTFKASPGDSSVGNRRGSGPYTNPDWFDDEDDADVIALSPLGSSADGSGSGGSGGRVDV